MPFREKNGRLNSQWLRLPCFHDILLLFGLLCPKTRYYSADTACRWLVSIVSCS